MLPNPVEITKHQPHSHLRLFAQFAKLVLPMVRSTCLLSHHWVDVLSNTLRERTFSRWLTRLGDMATAYPQLSRAESGAASLPISATNFPGTSQPKTETVNRLAQ